MADPARLVEQAARLLRLFFECAERNAGRHWRGLAVRLPCPELFKRLHQLQRIAGRIEANVVVPGNAILVLHMDLHGTGDQRMAAQTRGGFLQQAVQH